MTRDLCARGYQAQPSPLHFKTMMRRILHAVLMLCLCWQSLASAGMGILLADDDEIAHALLHFEGEAHHHDEHDGDFHQDSSASSVQHSMGDAGLFAPALMPTATAVAVGFSSPRPHEGPWIRVPLQVPQGLDRPPKSFS